MLVGLGIFTCFIIINERTFNITVRFCSGHHCFGILRLVLGWWVTISIWDTILFMLVMIFWRNIIFIGSLLTRSITV